MNIESFDSLLGLLENLFISFRAFPCALVYLEIIGHIGRLSTDGKPDILCETTSFIKHLIAKGCAT